MSRLFNIKTGFYLLAALAVIVALLWLDKEKNRLEGGKPETPARETTAKAKTSGEDQNPAAVSQEAGKAVFMKNCKICHTWERNGGHKAGPNLFGAAGAARGAKPGFRYSEALKNTIGNWDEGSLDSFLANPRSYIKETKMVFSGLKNTSERKAVIAFLNSLQEGNPGN